MDMTKAQIIKLIEVSVENRNEHLRALGYGEVAILYDIINNKSLDELKESLESFRREEKYYRLEYWNRNDRTFMS